MKKSLFTTMIAAALLSLSSMAYAQENNQAPSVSSTPAKSTVEAAKTMPDESMVILEGTITSDLGDEMYVFTDSTGSINIEIDDEEWNGVSPDSDMVIMIQGEVDKDGNLVEIDVEEVMMPQ